MSSSTSIFDSLWIIESLREGDLKTGRNLFDTQIARAGYKHPNLNIHFEQPKSAAELIALLSEISAKASSGAFPMIHFEIHGSPDGIQTTNGDVIDWETLRLPLISINEHCKLNLVVVLAACNGAYLIETAKHLDRAPFWATIGPTHEVSDGAVARDFGAFYETYFETLNGDLAVAALNGGQNAKDTRTYQFVTVEGLFKRAYSQYHKEYCLGKGKQKRIEDLLSIAIKHPELQALGINNIRKTVKSLLADNESYFEKIKRRFFFIDKYPDNIDRFTTSFSDISSA